MSYTHEERIGVLREVDLFSGLADERVDWLAGRATEIGLADGDVFVEPGSEAARWHVLAEGGVDWLMAVDGVDKVASNMEAVTYTGMTARDSQALFDKSEFYEPLDVTPEIPVFAAGIGQTESFDKTVLLASPHTEHRIWAGVLDKTVGHGDRSPDTVCVRGR